MGFSSNRKVVAFFVVAVAVWVLASQDEGVIEGDWLMLAGVLAGALVAWLLPAEPAPRPAHLASREGPPPRPTGATQPEPDAVVIDDDVI